VKKIVFAALLALAASLFVTAPASAHAALSWSSPEVSSAVSEAPTQVTLVFDDEIQVIEGTESNIITVTDENDRHFETGDVTVNGGKVGVELSPLNEGTYTVAYRVVSADGHPVSSEYQFEFTTTPEIQTLTGTAKTSEDDAADDEASTDVATNSVGSGEEPEPTDEASPVAVEDRELMMTTTLAPETADYSWAIFVATLVLLLGGGAFYVFKLRKPKA
jgi:methionine-rich copper-binding protein CopC